MSMGFDYVIVGGGSAGCVLANRLSARSSTRVLLLEAGRDTPPGEEPADVLDTYAASYYNNAYKWPGLKAHWRTRETSPAIGFDQGRIMGGGSSIMGMIALRGTPDDYDEWERLGARGWSWRNVLPYFRRLERDLDFDGEMHGEAGPVPIRRTGRERWTPLAHAIGAFAQDRQIPYVADMNADFRDGYAALPTSSTATQRASSAMCYLDAAVRRRANLTIIPSATMTGLNMEGRQVVGVTAAVAGEEKQFRARETILCAGAIHTPALLMRAGIGPARALRDLGIEVLADLCGVGANLQNHPLVFVGAHLRPHARQSPALRPHPMTCFRYSSGLRDSPGSDMYIAAHSKSSWNALGHQIANFNATIFKPQSRGRVTLVSAQPEQPPRIEFNFLAEKIDLLRLMDGFRRVVEIVMSPTVRPLCGAVFPVRFTDRLRRLNRCSNANAIKSAVIAKMIDLVPSLGDVAFATLADRRVDLATLVADREALADHVTNNVAGTFHVSGTCRMGRPDDPDAVVDEAGRVRAVETLRVVDASIMPAVPRGNTNIPVIMLAEKIADKMINDAEMKVA